MRHRTPTFLSDLSRNPNDGAEHVYHNVRFTSYIVPGIVVPMSYAIDTIDTMLFESVGECEVRNHLGLIAIMTREFIATRDAGVSLPLKTVPSVV